MAYICASAGHDRRRVILHHAHSAQAQIVLPQGSGSSTCIISSVICMTQPLGLADGSPSIA